MKNILFLILINLIYFLPSDILAEGQFQTEARFQPYIENGNFKGLRVFAIREESMWDIAGFNQNDVLLEIDNQRVESLENMTKIIGSTFQGKGAMHIFKVARKDQDLILKYKEE